MVAPFSLAARASLVTAFADPVELQEASTNPQAPVRAGTVLMVQKKNGRSKKSDGGEYILQPMIEDEAAKLMSTTTTAVYDVQSDRIFLAGVFRRRSVYARSDPEITRSRFVFYQVLGCYGFVLLGAIWLGGMCILVRFTLFNLSHSEAGTCPMETQGSELAYQLYSQGDKHRGLSTGCWSLSCGLIMRSLEQGCIMHLHFPSSSPTSLSFYS